MLRSNFISWHTWAQGAAGTVLILYLTIGWGLQLGLAAADFAKSAGHTEASPSVQYSAIAGSSFRGSTLCCNLDVLNAGR
jgi:hypothetical protein